MGKKKTCRHQESRFTHTVNSTSTRAVYYTSRRSNSQRLLLLSRCNRSISPMLVKKLPTISHRARCRHQSPTAEPRFVGGGVEGSSSFCTALTMSITLVFWGAVLFFSSLYTSTPQPLHMRSWGCRCCRGLHSQGQGEIISREGRRMSLLTAVSLGK